VDAVDGIFDCLVYQKMVLLREAAEVRKCEICTTMSYRHRAKTRWKEGKYDIEERKEGGTGDGLWGQPMFKLIDF
jgi:hypothetical protein